MSSSDLFALLGRGALLLALAWGLQPFLRKRAASLRHALWTVVFTALLALPVVAWLAPAIEIQAPFLAPVARAVGRAERALAGSVAPELATAPSWPLERAAPAFTTGELVLWTWLTGAALLFAVHFARRLVLVRILRRARPLGSEAWQGRLGRAAQKIGVRRSVRLVVSRDVPVPLALGVTRPLVVLPERALAWDEARLASVLRHELVHVRRADELWHTLAALARALHWPNPLAWAGFARLARERERSCDDRVLGTGVPASAYAGHLLAVDSERGAGPPFLPAGAQALTRSPELAERVRAVLDDALPRAALGARSFALVWMGTLCAAAPLGAVCARTIERATVASDGAGSEAVERARAIVALHEEPELDADALALLVAALGDDRQVEPRAVPLAPRGPRQGGLFETTPGKEAARVLARHVSGPRGEEVLSALEVALDDARPAAREKAAWALGCGGARTSSVDLARLVGRDPSPEVRRIAAWALGEMGARSERVTLEAALRDPSEGVRAQAAHSLGDLRDARAVPALRRALADPEPGVRRMVEWALRECGERQR